MGSRSSPTFACLFVGVLEALMLVAWEVQGGLLPHLLRRFIDDVFFLWRHGEAELVRFIAHLNSSHRTIKFDVAPGESYDFTTRSINYLDLRVWVDEQGFIQTTLYEKPCRVVSYLLPSSSHAGFICRNIPYSLAYRLVRIESTQDGLERNLAKLQEELVSRGYRPGSVAAAVEICLGSLMFGVAVAYLVALHDFVSFTPLGYYLPHGLDVIAGASCALPLALVVARCWRLDSHLARPSRPSICRPSASARSRSPWSPSLPACGRGRFSTPTCTWLPIPRWERPCWRPAPRPLPTKPCSWKTAACRCWRR